MNPVASTEAPMPGPAGLAVRSTGSPGRPTIVLLHGVGSNGSMWSGLVSALPGYQCLVPDLPGHGKSRSLPWRSRAHAAALVASLIEAEAAGGRAHVVGLSLGGSVALELLATRPDILDRVIVDGCAALPSRVVGPMTLAVGAIAPFLRFATVSRVVGRAFGVAAGPGLDDFVVQMQAVDPGSFRRAFADANAIRIGAGLLAAPCPTLLVAGEGELGHVRASNRLLARSMPAAEARMMPGAGHGWGPARYPDVHRRMVAAWLEGSELPGELLVDADEAPRAAGHATGVAR